MRTLGDMLLENAKEVIELKEFERSEICPVCSAKLQPGERFCSDNCRDSFYDERGEG